MSNFNFNADPDALDAAAIRVVPTFTSYDGTNFTNPFWYVENITKRFGAQPSSMIIAMPAAGWDNVAPSMAGVANSPMVNAKIFARVKAELNGAIIFLGSVVIPNENLDSDGGTVEAFDDRYLLEGVNINGSFWVQQNGGNQPCYRQKVKAWFNRDGLPNRTLGGGGLTYCFCTEEFGLKPGEEPNDPSINAAGVATFWDPESILKYLSETTDPAIVGDFVSAFKEYSFIPPKVTFPPDLGAGLGDFTASADTPQMKARKAPEMIFDATPLCEAIQRVMESAGPYALDVYYYKDGCTLACVYSMYMGIGRSLERATGTNAAFATDGCVIGGNLKRDGRQLFNEVVVAGDEQIVETRNASSDAATIEEQLAAGVELITAWDNAKTKAAVIKYYNDCITAGTPIALPELLQQYPNYLESWCFNPSKNFNKGTSEAAMPFCETSDRQILPHLITTFVLNPDAPATEQILLKTGFRPIAIETAQAGTSDTPEGDGDDQDPADGGDNGDSPDDAGDEGGGFDPGNAPAGGGDVGGGAAGAGGGGGLGG